MKSPIIKMSMCIAALAVGCGPTPPPQTAGQKQDAILMDPMGYRPGWDHDVSGGDMTHVGRGMDKDVNDVLNP